ncbi:hypothetical protein C8J56DRAFT_934289 [Mycena floridula]|nr:hypothetical protein C8J56DRAFT_934289 [Mycena floridula]
MAPAAVTGYYRYTDCWYKWPEILSEEHRQHVKAILAHDAIVDPGHPLNEDGLPGVKLFLGRFYSNGQTRLFFSSAQIEYVVNWLYEMGLTKTRVPLPYSDCLVTDAEILVSKTTYKDGGALRRSIKDVDKYNKRLKTSNPTLTSRQREFERAQTFIKVKRGAWLALDIENWEKDHTIITEVGFSCLFWEDGKEVHENGHFIVKESDYYLNGTYVPERREAFGFGESERISKKDLKSRINDLITRLRTKNGPLFLVFHDYSQDLKYLKAKPIEAKLDDLVAMHPDQFPTENKIYIFDTNNLFGALEENGTSNRKLEQVCAQLQIPIGAPFHNAGNDAKYTLLAFEAMASSEPAVQQRTSRWPSGNMPVFRHETQESDSDDDFY